MPLVCVLALACGRATKVDRVYCTTDGFESHAAAAPEHCVFGMQKWLEKHPKADVESIAAPSRVIVNA